MIMKTEELKQQYDEMTSRIASARMYDGRNSGVDVYVCDKCGHKFYTRYKDKGVTPFTIKCRHCQHGTMVHNDTISEQIANLMAFNVHNWVRPTFDQLQQLNEGAIEHVLNGGLMLEDELNNGESEIKAKFDKVQQILDSMQGSNASCMFIGHEGNHFVISGYPNNIEAQIIFAMCRYPVVRMIINTCATRFDELNKEFGDDVRNVTMDHLIEINSGK